MSFSNTRQFRAKAKVQFVPKASVVHLSSADLEKHAIQIQQNVENDTDLKNAITSESELLPKYSQQITQDAPPSKQIKNRNPRSPNWKAKGTVETVNQPHVGTEGIATAKDASQKVSQQVLCECGRYLPLNPSDIAKHIAGKYHASFILSKQSNSPSAVTDSQQLPPNNNEKQYFVCLCGKRVLNNPISISHHNSTSRKHMQVIQATPAIPVNTQPVENANPIFAASIHQTQHLGANAVQIVQESHLHTRRTKRVKLTQDNTAPESPQMESKPSKVITESIENDTIVQDPKLESLNRDLLEWFADVAPADSDAELRETFRKKFEQFLKTRWPESRLHMFGSSASGLCAKNSDVDLCFALPNRTKGAAERSAIISLGNFLKQHGVKHFHCILTARVPILKLLSTKTSNTATSEIFRFKFDLCINRMLGVHNSQLIKEYTSLDSRVRPLAFVLKQWANTWNVYNPSGGFSSYCLYLLLISFLQTRRPAVVPNLQAAEGKLNVDGYNCFYAKGVEWNSANNQSVASLLKEFFRYWSKFNFENGCVSIRAGKIISKNKADFDWSPVAVEDPFETDFNCARLISEQGIGKIQRVMRDSLKLLEENRVQEFLYKNISKPANQNRDNPQQPQQQRNSPHKAKPRTNVKALTDTAVRQAIAPRQFSRYPRRKVQFKGQTTTPNQ